MKELITCKTYKTEQYIHNINRKMEIHIKSRKYNNLLF